MPKLTSAELEVFFRAREKWKAGDPLPDRVEDVAEFHILPKLGDGRKANLQRGGKPESEATSAGAAFRATVNKFLKDEPPNPDPNVHPTSEELQIHLTHHDEVVSTIVTAMFKPDSQFTHRTVEQSVLYFAQVAVNDVQRLIEPRAKREERERGTKTVPLHEVEEEEHAVSDSRSRRAPRPESAIDKVALQADVRKHLGEKEGDKWLCLALLCEEGGYTWHEVACGLQSTTPPDGWSASGQSGATQPRDPSETWQDIKMGYTLPPWNQVQSAFPPPPVKAGALRIFYHRGARRLKSRCVR